MNFYLLGGLSPEEALMSEEAHSHGWKKCQYTQDRLGQCGAPATAILLVRGPTKQPGDIQVITLCSVHETEILKLFHEAPGYQGSTLEIPNSMTPA